MNETRSKSEDKLLEIFHHIEAEQIMIPPMGSIIKQKTVDYHLKDLNEILSNELQELVKIKNRKDEYIEEGKRRGQRILEDHKKQVESQDVYKEAEKFAYNKVKEAEDEAEEILNRAKQEANHTLNRAKALRNQLLNGTHDYLDDYFAKEEDRLKEQLATLSQNRVELKKSSEKKENRPTAMA